MLTRHAEKLPEEMREDLRRRKEEHAALVREHLERLMEERGIEGLRELHERFVETEYAHVPVPGLHEGKPISFALFSRLARRRYPYVYAEFLAGLEEALGLSREEARELEILYFFGETRKA